MTYKEKKKKFYKLSNDKVFKILFVNPKNEKFLKMLLEKVLKAKVTDICYLGTEVYPDNVKNKDVEKIKEDFIFVAFNLDEEELDELAKICEESRELVEMIKQVNKKYYNIFTIEEDEKRIHNTLMEEAKNDGIKQGIEQGIE